MSGHVWVALQYTPVEIEVDEHDGETLHTFTTEMADEVAREDSKLICFICGCDLTTQAYHQVCPGKN